jgi:hypothetical protein
VKQKAKSELSKRLHGKVDDPGLVQSAVADVHRSLKGEGLKSVSVEPTGDGKLKVIVSASDPEVATVIDPVTTLTKRDLEVRVSAKTGRATGISHTVVIGTWNGSKLPRMENVDKNHHAEDELAQYINTHRDDLGKARNGKNVLDVTISKSPCPRCGKRLQAFADANNVQLRLTFLALYRGGGTREELKANLRAMIKLQQAGAILRAPTLEEVLGMYDGPELDDASLEALRKRLANITEALVHVNERVKAMTKVKAGS